jgi:hypothetical protein
MEECFFTVSFLGRKGRQMQFITPDTKQGCACLLSQAGNTVLPGKGEKASKLVHQKIF